MQTKQSIWTTTLFAGSMILLGEVKAQSNSNECHIMRGGKSQRMAFLVGNAKHSKGLPEIKSAARDVGAIAQTLRKLDFSIAYTVNASADTISSCFRQALAFRKRPKVALLYYVGHATQIENQNYILASDTALKPLDPSRLISLKSIVHKLQQQARATVVILDASHDSTPRLGTLGGLSPTIDGTIGAAVAKNVIKNDPAGLMVIYTALPNTTAPASNGENSVFASALISGLAKPGLSLQSVMAAVTKSVGETTQWAQTPWVRTSMTGELKLNGEINNVNALTRSKQWALKSAELLGKGRRLESIASALKGLPKKLSRNAFTDHDAAHKALYAAVRTRTGWVPAQGEGFRVQWSRNGKIVATHVINTDSSYTSQIWDVRRNKLLFDLYHRKEQFGIMAISHDGQRLAHVEGNGMIAVWDIPRRLKIATYGPALPDGNGAVTDFTYNHLSFSPNGKRILSADAGRGNSLKIYNIKTGRLDFTLSKAMRKRFSKNKFGEISGAGAKGSFIDDEKACVAVVMEKHAPGKGIKYVTAILDISTDTFSEHGSATAVHGVQGISCSHDGKYRATAAFTKNWQVRFHIWKRGNPEPIFESDVATFVRPEIAPDGRTMLILDGRGLRFMDVETLKVIPMPNVDLDYVPQRARLHFAEGLEMQNQMGFFSDLIAEFEWKILPTGAELVRLAEKMLTPALRDEVDADRISYPVRGEK